MKGPSVTKDFRYCPSLLLTCASVEKYARRRRTDFGGNLSLERGGKQTKFKLLSDTDFGHSAQVLALSRILQLNPNAPESEAQSWSSEGVRLGSFKLILRSRTPSR